MNQKAPSLEVLFTPADFAALAQRDLSRSICITFDVLRATTTIVTALANGAASIIPVAEIGEALEYKQRRPDVLLAGERDGWRICASQTGGIDFDLGNSPREFTPERVRGRDIVITTTNGSRALRACAQAQQTLAASFRNLQATADWVISSSAENWILVCSGTGREAAFEDLLGAGALAALLWPPDPDQVTDSAWLARQVYDQHQGDLMGAMRFSRNGRRLLGMAELKEDVAYCLQLDTSRIVAAMRTDGVIITAGCHDPQLK